jgi:hypothetical protein
VTARVTRTFVDEVFWPELEQLDESGANLGH